MPVMPFLQPLSELRANMKKRIAARRTKWVGVLPEEMWLLIIFHTTDSTLSNLNRTCRAMHGECSKELARRKEAKLRFLRAAEGSCPTMVVCSSCVMFHARPSKRVNDMKNLYWEIAPTFSNFDLGGAKCRQNGARVRLAKQDELDWWRVHLAMRSHRFSGVHGPPVTDLNKITIRLRGLWTSSTEAVVHDDHLLLKVEGFRLVGRNEDYTRHMPCCKHLKTSSAMAHELRRIHDAFFECIARATSDEACPALSTDASSSSSTTTPTDTTTTVPPSTTTQPPTAATTNTTDPPPWPPNPTSPPFSLRDAHNRPSMLYRCASCPFEFRLRIGRGDAFRSEAADIVWRNRDLRHDRRGDGYMLCISGYADLGPCVDPAEPRWTALAADVVGPATVLAAGSGSNARASVNASSGPSSTGSGFAAQHKARTSSPAGVNAPHPSNMARSRSRVGSASAPDLKSGRHGKGAHVTPVALPLPQRPVEEFHRPTIESRFEHHNSLRPLDFDEVAVSIGASVGG